MTKQTVLPPKAVAETAKAINPMFQRYYKGSNRMLLRASDFYLPFFFGRKKRIEEFNTHYIPLFVAMLIQTIRSVTSNRYGRPLEELTEKVKEVLLPAAYYGEFNDYDEFFKEEVPENPNDAVKHFTFIFMNKIFGPNTTVPCQHLIESERHKVAINFQIGQYMYGMTRGLTDIFEDLEAKGVIQLKKGPNYRKKQG